MRLAVFEGDVCASIEKDVVAHNTQVARRFPDTQDRTRQGDASVLYM